MEANIEKKTPIADLAEDTDADQNLAAQKNLAMFLTSQPIVYTTKLNDMNTAQSDLKEYSAKEITERLLVESKPVFSPKSARNTNHLESDLKSYIKLTGLVQQINFKARLQVHSTNVRNMKLGIQCKQCSVVLTDIKKLIPVNRNDINFKSKTDKSLDKLILSSHNKPVESVYIAEKSISFENNINEIKLESEEIDSKTDKSLDKLTLSSHKKPVESVCTVRERISFENNINEIKLETEEIDIPDQNTLLETLIYESSDDDDDIVLAKVKAKPVLTKKSSQNKVGFIALVHKMTTAFVYCINHAKLVTDFYKMTNREYLNLASMYSKEEKIIKHYCCWFKRQEIVNNICKNYPIATQNFLRQQHTCQVRYCHCCCVVNKNTDSSNKNTKKRKTDCLVPDKPPSAADNWIRGLLNRRQLSQCGLIGMAMNYIPKWHEKENSLTKTKTTKEEFLKCHLLCIENENASYMIFEIGNKGDVVKAFQLDKVDEAKAIQQKYEDMGVPIINKKSCCWYKREKLLRDLRKAKLSPNTLKFVRTPHVCERDTNNCNCCCKPHNLHLDDIITPSVLKHTTMYKKLSNNLSITFKDTRVKIQNEPKVSNIQSADSSIEKSIVQNDITINVLNKLKNLKLDVNSEGKLEAVLQSPAKHFSIAELKVLSHILAHSRDEIVRLGISPEEFCNRVNSKPIPAINNDANTPTIPSMLQPLPPPQKEPKSQSQPINTYIISEALASEDSIEITKSILNMYDDLSTLIATKSMHYVNAFKSHFKHDFTSKAPIPDISEYSPVGLEVSRDLLPKIVNTYTLAKSPEPNAPGLANADTSHTSHGSKMLSLQELHNQVTMKTSDVTSKTVPSDIIPGLISKSTQTDTGSSSARPGASLDTSTLKVNASTSALTSERKPSGNVNKSKNTPKLRLNSTNSVAEGSKKASKNGGKNSKRKAILDNEPASKKIRVKSPSSLMTTSTTVENPVTSVANLSNLLVPPILAWPTPILLNQDSQIHTQANVTEPITTYLKGNNVISAPSLLQVVNNTETLNNINHMNVSGVVSAQAPIMNGGIRWLTLAPPGTIKSGSMLAQILQLPHVQPTVTRVEDEPVPPLVPLTKLTTNATIKAGIDSLTAKNPAPRIKTELPGKTNREVDVEKSIRWNLIVDNSVKK